MDDDSTPRLKRRFQTSDDRALQRRTMAPPLGVPVMPAPLEEPEVTQPWDLLDREHLTADELEVVKRSRRETGDPATYADVVKLTARVIRRELDDRSEQKRQLAEATELLDRPPRAVASKLQTDVSGLLLKMTLAQWVVGAVLVASLGSLGLAISALRSQAIHEGELNATIDRLKQDVQLLLIDDRASSRHQPKDPP